MPLGKRYSKISRSWVDVERERKFDYDSIDAEAWGLLISYWRYCPDKFLDICRCDQPLYRLELIQRVIIRAFVRYGEAFITGSRGLTKTYNIFLASMSAGVLYPGTVKRYFAPTLKQAAEIASSIFKAIQHDYPILCQHWNVVSDAQERFEIETKFGSVISINAMRGDTAHSVIAEECAAEMDNGQPFDHERFRGAVLPSIRAKRMINQMDDPHFQNFAKWYITSAGRRQNEAYNYRSDAFNDLVEGDRAMCLDIPADVAVLSNIRDISWYKDLKKKLTPEEWTREMDSIWTGASENPMIRDSVLSESRSLSIMEDRHCGDPSVQYVIGYDVSYAEGAKNAKCATAVFKGEMQNGTKANKYLKSLVYVFDNPPPRDAVLQARQLKEIWWRFNLEGANPTYLAIDAYHYGTSVIEALHGDLGDGLPPLCCVNHEKIDIELPGATPVIYPIKATSGAGGTHDPDSIMIQYAELEWEHRNVKLLISNVFEGVQAYKRANRIKDEDADRAIALPYIKTKELCGQISNLKKKPSGTGGLREERISKHIVRDMWSAVKYALRYMQILEHENLVEGAKQENPWTKVIKGNTKEIRSPFTQIRTQSRIPARRGGNRF